MHMHGILNFRSRKKKKIKDDRLCGDQKREKSIE
jgi:hypothetical protein